MGYAFGSIDELGEGHGFRKVREGITTIEEIFHIVGDASAGH